MSARGPRATIVTPTYNRAGFLPETLDSLLNQTWGDLEIIVVDDGSTDDTPEVLARYAAKAGGRLRVVRQENCGEATATNRGWSLATGEYFGVVCSDDPQPPTLVERSVRLLEERRDAIVSYPDWVLLDADGGPVKTTIVPEHSLAVLVGCVRCYIGPGAFIRRSAVHPVVGDQLRDPRFPTVSDYSCWLRLCLIGPFVRLSEPVAAWRDHPTGTTNRDRGRKIARDHVGLIDAFFARNDLPFEVRTLEDVAKRQVHWIAAEMLQDVSTTAWARERLAALRYDSPARIGRRLVDFARQTLGANGAAGE